MRRARVKETRLESLQSLALAFPDTTDKYGDWLFKFVELWRDVTAFASHLNRVLESSMGFVFLMFLIEWSWRQQNHRSVVVSVFTFSFTFDQYYYPKWLAGKRRHNPSMSLRVKGVPQRLSVPLNTSSNTAKYRIAIPEDIFNTIRSTSCHM